MYDLLVCLRALQLMSHHFHNLAARVVFFQDHEFFAEVYGAAETGYDAVIERIIGLQGEGQLNLQQLMSNVSKKLEGVPSVGVKENKVFYQYILKEEMYICQKVKELIASGAVTPGTEQMLGDLADKSEIRQFKIKQRIK